MLIITLSGCQTLDLERVAAVETGEITIDNETASVTATGVLLDLGQGEITQHGHCWSTSPNPTIEDASTQLGSVTQMGEFTSRLSPIAGNKKYFVRSYLITKSGEISYGNVNSVNTPREVFFDMSLVQGGSFQMGNDNGSADERPAHEVTLSDFYIMKYEAT